MGIFGDDFKEKVKELEEEMEKVRRKERLGDKEKAELEELTEGLEEETDEKLEKLKHEQKETLEDIEKMGGNLREAKRIISESGRKKNEDLEEKAERLIREANR